MDGREAMTIGVVAAAAAAAAAAAETEGSSGSYQSADDAVKVETLAPGASAASAAPSASVPAPAAAPQSGPSSLVFGASAAASSSPAAGSSRKKRGRPRKYGPDGSVIIPLNPSPISASAPEFRVGGAPKRGRGRPSGEFFMKPQPLPPPQQSQPPPQPQLQQQPHSQQGFEVVEPLGELVAYSAGANFTPHVITVAAGEDVTMKIISFSQQGPRAICILSANGVISNVTLRQPDSSGGTLTYEGRFELLSLSGSFMPTDYGGTRSRHGGMSVSLASPDGRVVGGSVAGLLVAASPVQVVVGSFMPGYQVEHKTKRPKLDGVGGSISVSLPAAAITMSGADVDDAYTVALAQQHRSSTVAAPKPILTAPSSFKADNWTPSSAPNAMKPAAEASASLPSA